MINGIAVRSGGSGSGGGGSSGSSGMVASNVSMVMKELGKEIEVEMSFVKADKMGGVISMSS